MLDPQVVTLGLLDSSGVSVAQRELICREAMKRITKTGGGHWRSGRYWAYYFLAAGGKAGGQRWQLLLDCCKELGQ